VGPDRPGSGRRRFLFWFTADSEDLGPGGKRVLFLAGTSLGTGFAALAFLVSTARGWIGVTRGSILVAGLSALSLLVFWRFRVAERRAIETGSVWVPSPGTSFLVIVVPEGGVLWQFIGGREGGEVWIGVDGLRLSVRRFAPGWGGLLFIMWLFGRRTVPAAWVGAVNAGLLAAVILLAITSVRTRKRFHPWAEIPTAAVKGHRVAFEFAVAGDRKDLVVEVRPPDREKFLAMLRERTCVEVLDDAAPA
jgi:hypothetical protein